ncbi:hypothetical protein T01_4829 [Trichinella spiralis]|uniref:Uncharacterized protein n=1 Tax=Trichinella spiralis TaxID=6334 RepID=A0A0V1AV50_TRISP|nr:hypothetical protein T01_4829 [Trichinella spiralis]
MVMGHHAKGRENVDGTDRQDHLKTGCDRNEETQTLVLQVSEVMSTGGFVKKKTANNDPAAVAYLPSEAVSPVEMNPLWKALCLYWNRLRDRHSGVHATRQR